MKWEKGFGKFIQHQHIFTWCFLNKKNWWCQPSLISYSVWHLSKRTPYSSAICQLEAWCGWIGDVILLCAIFSFFLSTEAVELMYIGYTRHKVRKSKVHYQCWHLTEIYQIRNSGVLSCIGHLSNNHFIRHVYFWLSGGFTQFHYCSFLKAGECAQKKCMFYNTTPVEADMWILGHMSVCVFIISCLVLDALQNVGCFSFILSLTSLTLTKFIEKCTNIYNIKLVSLTPP